MEGKFDPKKNYLDTLKKIGYVPRKEATQETYDKLGFMSGLEVHQQLLTDKKLFCHCPAGIYHKDDEYDAEIVRHMRPTLSELGEYDGTALMEFKTKKEIVYRINNENACTYEVDDTPPFIINHQALDRALQIAIASNFNIVGEVHITRKQYLDGSIPTGFQRTAILGVEGEIQLKNKKVGLIQLSIEEDACREISDIGHRRIYKTDRLGMPLIETVTYPVLMNPDEVKEACDYIRFLNRSTGNVRTGIGATREDVNVSCKGGTRIEIKGVSHTKWIPELTHNECFRQWALLRMKDELLSRVNPEEWKMTWAKLNFNDFKTSMPEMNAAKHDGQKLYAVNLPHFKGILSYYNQPNVTFAQEISDRLKVIACLERPNIIHTETFEKSISETDMKHITSVLETNPETDAIIVFWAPEADVNTALDVIEERCKMAFEGIPKETRKCYSDGTTKFERVLPGADRMYPDTDSTPIPLAANHIEELSKDIPTDIHFRLSKLVEWGVPKDTFTYILSRNLYPVVDTAINELGICAKCAGRLFGQQLKYVEGHYKAGKNFTYTRLIDMIKFIKKNDLHCPIGEKMLPEVYSNPDCDFEEILRKIDFVKYSKEEIFENIDELSKIFDEDAIENSNENKINWIMGSIRPIALGNVSLEELKNEIIKRIK